MAGATTLKSAAAGGLRMLKDFLRESKLMKSLPETETVESWHGTPYRFAPVDDNPLGAFSNGKINTGEGAQAFSYGHYSTGHRPLAEEYRDSLTAAKKGRAGSAAWQSRGTLAEAVHPDIQYAPTLRFNMIDKSSPGYWLNRDPANRRDALMANPTWAKQLITERDLPRIGDERVQGALSQIMRSNDRNIWLPQDVLGSMRNDIVGANRLNSAEKLRRQLPNVSPETYHELRKALPKAEHLPSTQPAPREVTPDLWAKALDVSRTPEFNQWGREISRTPHEQMNAELGSMYANPELRALLAKDMGVENPGVMLGMTGNDFSAMSAPYRVYKSALGRNGLLDYAEKLRDPAELLRIKRALGLTDDTSTASLYKLLHKADPEDLWFLDTPLIGQTDDFIKRFHDAGTALTSDFGKRRSLSQSGHDTYNWLMSQNSGSGLNSMPNSKLRNAEITDKLLEADVPGAMFLRGGRRDIDAALNKPFDQRDFNFVTYDPSKIEIIQRFKRGGLVQMKERGCK